MKSREGWREKGRNQGCLQIALNPRIHWVLGAIRPEVHLSTVEQEKTRLCKLRFGTADEEGQNKMKGRHLESINHTLSSNCRRASIFSCVGAKLGGGSSMV